MLVIALPRDTKKHSDISIHNHTTTSATIPHLSTSISSSSITSSSSAASHHPLLNKKDSSPALVSGDSGSISTPTSCAKNVDFEMDIRGDSDDAYSDGEDSSGGSLLLGGGSGGGRIRRKKVREWVVAPFLLSPSSFLPFNFIIIAWKNYQWRQYLFKFTQ